MKLSQKTEWIVIGVLILYIAFMQPLPILRDALSTPIGKVVGLGAIVYVWKSVSAIVAVLLAIAFVRCATSTNVWEMFSGAETSCECEMPEEYTWDVTTKKCTSKDGKEGAVKSCTCASGYAWDGGPKGKKECVASSGTQPPVPAPATNPVADKLAEQAKVDAETVKALEAAPATAAPAAGTTTGPVGTTPVTTPGPETFSNPPPMSKYFGGVVPSGVTSSTPAMV